MQHNLLLHKDQIFVLVLHPQDSRIFASGVPDLNPHPDLSSMALS